MMMLRGLLIAAILAAATSNLSAALNSLYSTTVMDFYSRLRPGISEVHRERVARFATIVWGLVLFMLALLLPFVWQDFLQVGSWNFSLLAFVAVLVLLLRARALNVAQQTIVLWLFAYFSVYAFVIRIAGLHFYTLMPALALIVATTLMQTTPPVTHHALRITDYVLRIAPVLRVACCVVLLLSALAFDYVAYLGDQPEYALNYPQTALAWSPTFYAARPRDFFFGFPYRYGWSVIGALYRQGVLRKVRQVSRPKGEAAHCDTGPRGDGGLGVVAAASFGDA